MRGIFKLFRRRERAIFSCPKDALVRPQGCVKPLDRATSPFFAPFLTLKPHKRTLNGAVYEVTP
jgi:hypothetical protein